MMRHPMHVHVMFQRKRYGIVNVSDKYLSRWAIVGERPQDDAFVEWIDEDTIGMLQQLPGDESRAEWLLAYLTLTKGKD